MKITALRRIAAGTGAFALALAGFVGAGAAASADVGPDQPSAPDKGTLTINKYEGAPVEEGESPDPADLLDGVEFTVTQVGRQVGGACTPVDLTNAADWDGLEALFDSAPNAPADPFCLTSATSAKATEDGQAVFDLSVGVYFVEETDPGPNSIVSKVPSFYVSIPTSLGAAGDGWSYDVVADPKNQLMEAPSKVVDDQVEFVLGSEVTWTMTVPVPTLNNGETFTSAMVDDELDSRLELVDGSSVVSVGSTDLVEGTHFTVSGRALWTFTAAGLAELDRTMGADLTISFDTKVVSVGDGSIPNSDYSSTFNGTTVPGGPTPYTYWGQLAIKKVDDSANAKALKDAEFQVFTTDGDGKCAADAPASGAIATGTSDDQGIVQWTGQTDSSMLGLWVENVDNGPADPMPARDYCVYETVVPAGHTAVPIDNPVTIKPGESHRLSLTVVNTKKDGPDLPLTGAQGTLLMTVGGLVLVGAGGGALALSRRRSNA